MTTRSPTTSLRLRIPPLRRIVSAAAAITLFWSSANAAPDPHTLKLATWNLEWLIAPEAFKALKPTCAPAEGPRPRNNTRQIPCDVAYTLQRGTRDFKALARYASQLNADVIALQEVDGHTAASLVFPGYEFCFTARAQVQNNGFAIRVGLPYRCGPDVRTLAPNDRLRRGAQLVLFPDSPREIHLLSIHLKSGCSRDPLNGPSKACAELARQIPALETWIDTCARAGQRFAVLGDFNRDLLAERGPARTPGGQPLAMWPELDDSDPPEADLVNATEHAPFRNCRPGQGYGGYIDSIVLSRALGIALVPGSFERITYTAADARRTRLSDHCPVAVRVRLP